MMDAAPRRRRRWLWPVVTVLLLAGIGAGAVWTGWLSPGKDDPAASPSTSPTTASPQRSSDGYDVAAGKGGTDVAADGTTPVGYDGSCQGAVQAATNYNTFVVEGMATERWTPESFQAVLDQIVGFGGDDPSGLRSRLVDSRQLQRQSWVDLGVAQGLPSIGTSHPENGGYLVRSCSAEGQAAIDIVSYWDEPLDGAVSTVTYPDGHEEITGGGPMMHRVSVAWFNGDWRLVEWDELDLSSAPLPNDNVGTTSGPAPSPQYRHAWMRDAADPWMEYTNAPQ